MIGSQFVGPNGELALPIVIAIENQIERIHGLRIDKIDYLFANRKPTRFVGGIDFPDGEIVKAALPGIDIHWTGWGASLHEAPHILTIQPCEHIRGTPGDITRTVRMMRMDEIIREIERRLMPSLVRDRKLAQYAAGRRVAIPMPMPRSVEDMDGRDLAHVHIHDIVRDVLAHRFAHDPDHAAAPETALQHALLTAMHHAIMTDGMTQEQIEKILERNAATLTSVGVSEARFRLNTNPGPALEIDLQLGSGVTLRGDVLHVDKVLPEAGIITLKNRPLGHLIATGIPTLDTRIITRISTEAKRDRGGMTLIGGYETHIYSEPAGTSPS